MWHFFKKRVYLGRKYTHFVFTYFIRGTNVEQIESVSSLAKLDTKGKRMIEKLCKKSRIVNLNEIG